MEKMKNSGVEWIGEIPENWNVSKIKYEIKNIGSGTTPDSGNELYYDEFNGVNWIQSGDLYGKKYVKNTEKKITELAIKENKSLCLYRNPFIVIAMYGASVGNISISSIDAYTNQACCVIHVDNCNSLKYLYYYLCAAKEEMLKKAFGGTQPNISQIIIKNLNYLKVSIEEQQLIAEFIDNKVEKIEDILNDLNKQIEILEKYKKSLITETVTKGLASNVAMKDSGIEWIGNIPMESNMISIGALIMTNKIEVQDGNHGEIHPVAADYVDEGIPFIMASDIHNGKLNLEKCKFITEERAKHLRIGFAKKNDVLLTHKGTIGEVGIVENIKTPFIMLTPQVTYYRIVDGKYLDDRYLYYVLQSKYTLNQLEDISSMQSTRKYVGILAQEKIKLIVHNIEKQKEISDYLDKKCNQIDEIIKDKQTQIEKMEKYKKSLIYEYVTGKKRVKGAEELYV